MDSFMAKGTRYRSGSIWLVSEDGLWDICIGLLLFGIGITISINQFIWLIGIFTLVYFFILMAGKEAITRPRMINFDIRERQLLKFKIVAGIDILILVLILGISAVMYVIFGGVPPVGNLDEFAILILGVISSILLIQFGYLFTRGFRFYSYAVLVMLAISMAYSFNLAVVSVIYIIGAIFSITGLYLLVRFMYSFPKGSSRGG
jgi:hypothetical protein